MRATALRSVSNDLPGWIDASVRAVDGQDRRIVANAPVLTPLTMTAESAFPIELWIEAGMEAFDDGVVSLLFRHGVETAAALQRIRGWSADVIWP